MCQSDGSQLQVFQRSLKQCLQVIKTQPWAVFHHQLWNRFLRIKHEELKHWWQPYSLKMLVQMFNRYQHTGLCYTASGWRHFCVCSLFSWICIKTSVKRSNTLYGRVVQIMLLNATITLCFSEFETKKMLFLLNVMFNLMPYLLTLCKI